jgi:hypothetical protein
VTARLHVFVAVAVLLSAAACRTTGTPYTAPAPDGAPFLGSDAAAKLLVLVVADADPRVNAPWIEKAERAADAVAAALAQAGFRTTRRQSMRTTVRVTVSLPLRGPDFTVAVDANGKELDRWAVNGAAWGAEELAELGKAVRQWLERSDAIAALAGVAGPGQPPNKAQPAAPAADRGPVRAEPAAPPPGKRRLAVLDFRGAVPPQVLAVLADQTRAAAAEAGRASGTTVMTRESVNASSKEKGRSDEPCGDAACDLETARAAGADLVVTGEVSAIGDARFLVLRLVDTAAGALIASRHAKATDDLALVEAARPAAAALFQ